MDKVVIKRTGHEDIDELLLKTHTLRKEGERLKEEIEASLSYKPFKPFASRSARKNTKRYRLRSTLS